MNPLFGVRNENKFQDQYQPGLVHVSDSSHVIHVADANGGELAGSKYRTRLEVNEYVLSILRLRIDFRVELLQPLRG
jgi:hypothetical protein